MSINTVITPVNQLLKEKKFNPMELRKKLELLAGQCQNMREVLDGVLEADDPLYGMAAIRLAAYEGAAIENLSTAYVETLIHILLGGICSVNPGSGEQEQFLNLLSIEGGNSLLPTKMAEALGERLHMSMPLVKVDKRPDGTFDLLYENGSRVTADVLVLAIPCGVYEKIAFTEQVIPQDRLQAIQKVQYGSNSKILVPLKNIPEGRSTVMNREMLSFIDHKAATMTVYYTGESSLFCRTRFRKHTGLQGRLSKMGLEPIVPLISIRFLPKSKFLLLMRPLSGTAGQMILMQKGHILTSH